LPSARIEAGFNLRGGAADELTPQAAGGLAKARRCRNPARPSARLNGA
jgi:hypothetical protein